MMTDDPSTTDASSNNEHASHEQAVQNSQIDGYGHARRSFLVRISAAVVSTVVGLVPAGIGGVFFLNPLFKRKREAVGFVDLGIFLDALPEDGTPQLVTVAADRQDAWNMFPDQPIGTVWLRRIGDQVIALNSICPHLGCSVEHRSADDDFFCPCHTSTFDLSGTKLNQIPPRDMDSLEVRIERRRVLVKYQTFRAGTSSKIEV